MQSWGPYFFIWYLRAFSPLHSLTKTKAHKHSVALTYSTCLMTSFKKYDEMVPLMPVPGDLFLASINNLLKDLLYHSQRQTILLGHTHSSVWSVFNIFHKSMPTPYTFFKCPICHFSLLVPLSSILPHITSRLLKVAPQASIPAFGNQPESLNLSGAIWLLSHGSLTMA